MGDSIGQKLKGKVENIDPVLCAVTGTEFYNTSKLDLLKVLSDPGQVAGNLREYIAVFSPAARDILDKFDFNTQITRLDNANLVGCNLAVQLDFVEREIERSAE